MSWERDRILTRIEVDENGCWVWQANRNDAGYGRITVDKIVRFTHRVSYETFVGPIPDGMQLDHLCRNPPCCNPEHLEPVTPLENVARSPIHNGAKTHCPQGHEYDEVNTRVVNGRRNCITCARAAAARHRQRAKAK